MDTKATHRENMKRLDRLVHEARKGGLSASRQLELDEEVLAVIRADSLLEAAAMIEDGKSPAQEAQRLVDPALGPEDEDDDELEDEILEEGERLEALTLEIDALTARGR